MALWWICCAYVLFAYVMVLTQYSTVHLFQIMVKNVLVTCGGCVLKHDTKWL
jgi:hypothetical protein